jgi:hypothetical protein
MKFFKDKTSISLSTLLLVLYLLVGMPQHSEFFVPGCGVVDELATPSTRTSRSYFVQPSTAQDFRDIQTVVVLPNEFFRDPATGQSLPQSTDEIKAEAEGAIAAANQTLAALGLRIVTVEYKTFRDDASDPYAEAVQQRNAFSMLSTATTQYNSYQNKNYDLVLLLGRGAFGGKFGLAYPGSSCVSQQHSVVFATQAGTTEARKYAFAQTIAHEVGHFLGMNHDSEQHDDGRSVMWPTFVAKPFGFSNTSIAEAAQHSGPGKVGGRCFAFQSSGGGDADSDGDGVKDSVERTDASDELDAGSYKEHLNNPVYALWNGFLAMINIVEVVNPASEDSYVTLRLHNAAGGVEFEDRFLIPARGQYDIVLNSLDGFIANSYGLVSIEYEGQLEGRTTYYRNAPTGGFEFAFSIPFQKELFGTTYAAFNTFQPSSHPEHAVDQVANWLSIVNLESVASIFRLHTYGSSGEVIATRTVVVPGKGRVDLDGGHGISGADVVGVHEIIPVSSESAYLAQVIRYGGNAPAGVEPDAYRFAFPLIARAGSGRPLQTFVSTENNADNWVELANTSRRTITLDVVVTKPSGELLIQRTLEIPSHSQQHLDAAAILRDAGVDDGSITVSSNRNSSLLVNSMSYFRNSEGSVSAIFGSQAGESFGVELTGSYNLFLDAENDLKIANKNSEAEVVVLKLGLADSIREYTFTIPANGMKVVKLHDTLSYGTAPDTYGFVSVAGSASGKLAAELIRIAHSHGSEFSEVDFAFPTAVR